MQATATVEDASFMADILGEVDNNMPSRRPVPPTKSIKLENRRKVRVLSPPIEGITKKKIQSHSTGLPATPPVEGSLHSQDDNYLPPIEDDDVPMSDPIPSSPIVKAIERKSQVVVKAEEEEDEDIMEVSQAVGDDSIKVAKVNISGSRPVPKILKKAFYPTPESSSPPRPAADFVDPASWNDVTAKLNVLSSPAPATGFGKARIQDAIEEDGSVRMFWTDYIEVNGSLCLFGKVKDKSTGSFVSAFVKVDNILRKLFFLPREHKKSSCFPP